MRHFPLFLDVNARDVLVVGGGGCAARKAAVLADAGARVVVIASRPGAELSEAAENGRMLVDRRSFTADDVAGKLLVVAASDDAALDARVSAAARAAGVPVNVVDRPSLCTFIWPAIVDRDPLTVAISSAGTAPVLARAIRARLEALLPARLGRLARFAEDFRAAVKATSPPVRRGGGSGSASSRARSPRRCWPATSDERARADAGADQSPRRRWSAEQGIVHLVGAGPGDPELLTLRALRVLQEADVIVHDRLIGPRVLDYARRDAERIYVGKARGSHARTQDEINELLARHARAGRRVVRLKGGDPFVFGRGGEEREYLLRHGAARRGRSRHHRRHRLRRRRRHSADAPRPGADPDHRHGARPRRRAGPRLARARPRSPDARHLHGRLGRRAHRRAADRARPRSGHAGGGDRQRHTGRAADRRGPASRPRTAWRARRDPGPALILIGEVVRHAEAWPTRARSPLAAVN